MVAYGFLSLRLVYLMTITLTASRYCLTQMA
ncbi:hypothetical protein [Escherichia phage PH1062]|nr:hypothetical protein [Escherichia phage PH1062]